MISEAFPKTPKGGEKGMVCHWYVTLDGTTAHLASEVFSASQPSANGKIPLDWCAFLVLDAQQKAEVRGALGAS